MPRVSSFSERMVPHLTLPSLDVAYELTQRSSLQPVIVLHGLGDSAIHTWMPVFEFSPLADTSALFIDLPGFGKSTADRTYPASIEDHADAIASVMQHMDITRTAIIGHSMGANTAILVAKRYPGLVNRLVLAEPLLHAGHSILAAQVTRFTEDGYADRGHSMLVRATRQQAGRGDIAAREFLPTLTMANARVMYRSAASLLADRDPDLVEMLNQLASVSTLVVGDRSGGMHLNASGFEGEVLRVARAGHSMHTEQPEATARVIREALDQ